MNIFDVFIIGTGVSGTAIARSCAKEGLKVGITDERMYGGTCAMRGCIPKKVLVGATEVVESANRLIGKGIDKVPSIIWDSLIAFKESFVEEMPEKKEQSFREKGIETFHGAPKFVAENQLEIAGETVEAKKIVIATGAKPRDLKIPGNQYLMTSDDFLELEQLPESMLFIGGGYIAFEFAHVAARCGVEVTIVDVASKVLHNFDQDIVQHLMEATKALGIEIVTGAEVTEVVKNKEGYTVIAQQNDKSVRYKTFLVINASGRTPAIQGLNLKKGNVKFSKNGVEVNEFLQSVSNPVVYASGDVTATKGLPLTPMASREAKVVVTNILRGNQEKPDYSVMPTVVFTIPPLATVGLTEKLAKKGKLNFRVKYDSVPEWFSAKHRNAPQYAYKVLIENESEKILGAHLVGPNAGEMINLFALAIKTGCTVSQLKSIPFTFPTSGADINSMV